VGVLAATAAAAAFAAVCAAVGALAVASTGAAPAALVLKLEIVALSNLQHGWVKEEVLPVVVQFHHARQQLGASRRCLCRELARAREGRLDVGGRRLLAANLGQIDGVMDGQDGLVIGLELMQVEAVAFLAVVNAG